MRSLGAASSWGDDANISVQSANSPNQTIANNQAIVTLGDKAVISAKGAQSESIFTQGEGAVTTLGNNASITASSSGSNVAVGVYAEDQGENSIGTGASISTTSQDGMNVGVLAYDGDNQIGDNAQIQVSSTGSGYAYGTYSVYSSGSNQIGKNVSISASSESRAAIGVYAGSESTTTVDNGVTISADGTRGMGVLTESQGTATFLGDARISGGRYSLVSMDEGSLLDLSADGTKVITGNMLSAYGGDIDVNMSTAGSLFTGASSVLSGSSLTLAMSNGALWEMTGGSSVSNLTLNSGATVDMTANADYQILTVGNFSGNDGIFYMKSDLDSQAADQSDKVNITSAAAGSSGLIRVYDASFARDQKVTGARHQLLVTDESGNAVFSGTALDTGGLWDITPTIENGAYVRANMGDADAKDTEWYLTKLVKTINADTRPLLFSGDSTYAMYRRSIDTLRQRRGNLRQRDKTDDADGIWVRNRGGQMEGNGWDSWYNIFQLGYEYSDNPGSIYGIFAERGIASPDYGTGRGKEHTLSGGVYGTWFGRHGRYTDIVAKIGWDDTRIDTFGSYPDKANFRTAEQSLSIEHGRTLYRGKNNEFFIEPRVQLVLGHMNDTSYTTERGTHVERDSLNSMIGRLGIVLGKTKDEGKHPYDYYLKASVLHEFRGDQNIHMTAANGEFLDTHADYGETWVEVGLGGTYRFNTNTMAYVDFERSYSSTLTEKWQINAGISWQF